MRKVRILVSVASFDWSLQPGQIIEEGHPLFSVALPLAWGPNAELIEDETETSTLRPAAETAVGRGPKRRR